MKLATAVSLILALALPASGAPLKEVVLKVKTSPNPWAENQLEDKLLMRLSRSSDHRIYSAETLSSDLPEFPSATHNLDSLINWGLETGRRYLLFVDITDEKIVRKKTFSLPLIFQRYEVIAVVRGEIRLVDLSRNKLLVAEPFEVKKRGKRIFQAATDDDKYDPAIHLSPVEKIRFLDELGDKLARHIVSKVSRPLGIRK